MGGDAADGETWALVLAAGSGRRFGGLKQLSPLGEARVIDHVVATAIAACDRVALVLPAGLDWDGDPVDALATGGATHLASTRAGLAAIPGTATTIVIVAASHPLAGVALYRATIDAVAAGADCAVPIGGFPDAIKRLDGDRVVGTVDRTDLGHSQSPSAYRAELLRRALADEGETAEEVEQMERMGARVIAVPGEPTNLHIATVRDLEMAEALLPLVR